MRGFTRIVQRLHRRSVWQVLAVYLAASWVVLQVVDQLTESAGLPDWVPGFALVLLLIGLPIVLATAIIQTGTRRSGTTDPAGGEPSVAQTAADGRPIGARSTLFTWRNAIAGGVAAFALLGVAVAGYFAMRSLGIGPPGSLVAQGVLETRDPVVLADFENRSADAEAGTLVTEALRVDLVGSRVLALAPPARVQQVLERMDRADDTVLTPALAREVAQRAGFKAVLQGDVSSAGAGYVLTASLVAAESGDVLAGFRESATDAGELVRAIDKLSERIRYKVGEALPQIRAGEPLADVTTSSLDALRRYVEAVKLSDRGQYRQTIALLEEATQLDTAFAMAYRKLAVAMGNQGGYPGTRRREIATKAYEHRDRLSEIERYHTIAYYHLLVTQDYDAVINAYQNVLRLDSHDPAALNNLAITYQALDRHEDAAPLLETVVSVVPVAVAHSNLISNYLMMRDTASAAAAIDRFEQEYPEHPSTISRRMDVELHRGNATGVYDAAARLASFDGVSIATKAVGVGGGSYIDRAAGRWRDARTRMREAAQLAEVNGARATALSWTLGEVLLLHVVVADTTGAQRRLREILATGAFDDLPPEGRPWNTVMSGLTELGMLREARALLTRWETELPEDSRSPSNDVDFRRQVRQLAIIETGDLDAISRGYRQAQVEERCTRCFRWPLAEVETQRGNFAEAIALYENSVEEPVGVRSYPWNRVIALERLGPLYEKVGEFQKAAAVYAEFAEAWKDADPELQPRVRAARERARILLAEGANR